MYKWVELFAGGGGAGTGIEQAGHEVAYAVEIDPIAAECYRINHPSVAVLCEDVRAVNLAPLKESGVNALWASPVCKQDSEARQKNKERREDASIGLAIKRYVEALKPDLVIIENVAGYERNPVFPELLLFLNKQEYTIDYKVLSFDNYGVPQSRDRLLLQARKGPIAWPDMIDKKVSWYEAIEPLLNELPVVQLANWQSAALSAPRPALVYGHFAYKREGEDKRRVVIQPHNKASHTVTSSKNCLDRRVILPDGTVRSLCIKGNAAIQTFPASYIWPDNKQEAIKIIGNAVPPLFVQRLVSSYQVCHDFFKICA